MHCLTRQQFRLDCKFLVEIRRFFLRKSTVSVWIIFFYGGNGFNIIKNPRAPKILNLDSCNSDFQKFPPDFIRIMPDFPFFFRTKSSTPWTTQWKDMCSMQSQNMPFIFFCTTSKYTLHTYTCTSSIVSQVCFLFSHLQDLLQVYYKPQNSCFLYNIKDHAILMLRSTYPLLPNLC